MAARNATRQESDSTRGEPVSSIRVRLLVKAITDEAPGILKAALRK